MVVVTHVPKFLFTMFKNEVHYCYACEFKLIVPTGFQRAAHRESADGPREFNAVVCLVK
jgi:hypothetical protein